MAKTFTVQDFFKRFPDDDTCLEHLMLTRYGETQECPKCGKAGKFARLKKMPAYSCPWCGHHIHPMAGTPFALSRTSLQKWFYAIYLFTTSRNGVAATELQRQLGVTYKTAWRMAQEIRKYMGAVDGDDGLSGHVEMDEAYIGGKDHQRGRPGAKSNKTILAGMMQRGGDVIVKVVPNTSARSLIPLAQEHVAKGSTISTDEWHPYRQLPSAGYAHGSVTHRTKQYVRGIHHTNSIEGFWGQLKRSIVGTHIHVSKKHLAKYLAEFEFRFNMRKNPEWMFHRLMTSF